MTHDELELSEGIEVRSDRRPYAMVPEALLYDWRLSPQAVRLWGILERHANRERRAWPSRRRLAELMWSSTATVDRAARELEAHGWLTIERRPRPVPGSKEVRYLSSIYTLIEDVAVPLRPVRDKPKKSKGGSSPANKGGPPADHPDRAEGVAHGRATWPTGDDMNESQGNESQKASTSLPSDARLIFDTWIEATGRTGATMYEPERRNLLERRLREGWPVEDLLDAVRGWRHFPHNRGENAAGKKWNDLELLLRHAPNIERFRDADRQGGTDGPGKLSDRERQQRESAQAAGPEALARVLGMTGERKQLGS